eukprot:CAMPEP_0171228322 /NCGR_PEP_ID=MMETSP0790-20130122/38306_1 /TAXON_ID=2925 /ORGANISM="Alexandrium catenella, Strain OF101" /LENGTH=152 /DNA_ID=CAMNT_0011694469 /DNA_START=150 /DNA_END=607 /DNA_ORIENTATION=+
MAPALYSVHVSNAEPEPCIWDETNGDHDAGDGDRDTGNDVLAPVALVALVALVAVAVVALTALVALASVASLAVSVVPSIAHGAVAAQVQPLCDALLLVEMAALQLDWLRAQVGDLGPVDLVEQLMHFPYVTMAVMPETGDINAGILENQLE